METLPITRTKFNLLRSHWTEGDTIWIAEARKLHRKILANFCYFGTGINSNIVEIYADSAKTESIKIVIPQDLILMKTSRIIQYLELQIL